MGILQRLRSFFRRTDDETEDGEPPSPKVQSEATSAAAPLRDIIVGFDWGTSCSKVVIRDPYGPDSPSYLVDFDSHGYSENSYLLPSSIYLDGGGRVRFRKTNAERTLPEIKLRLMQHPGEPVSDLLDVRPRELAVLYIARALRHARQWFQRTYSDRYRQYRIEWQFNLGIPATGHDDETTCKTFEAIARVAWGLSLRRESTLDDAREAFLALERDEFDPGIHDDYVNVVPEVAAQVVGYARSTLRRSGLHVLVDVGASTLDVAGFILTDAEGEDRYSILTASVNPLGAYSLERERVEYLKRLGRGVFASPDAYEEWAKEMARRCADPMRSVPSDVRAYFPPDMRAAVQLSKDGTPDASFRTKCFRELHAVLDDLKQNRDPNSEKWEEGLPIFLAGGGKSVQVYTDAFRDLNAWWQQYTQVAPFQIETLPSLENMEAPHLRDGDAHRFSVAYGLSFPIVDIGTIKPPHTIENVYTETHRSRPFDYLDTKAWT